MHGIDLSVAIVVVPAATATNDRPAQICVARTERSAMRELEYVLVRIALRAIQAALATRRNWDSIRVTRVAALLFLSNY
jgi:hypothetical protein